MVNPALAPRFFWRLFADLRRLVDLFAVAPLVRRQGHHRLMDRGIKTEHLGDDLIRLGFQLGNEAFAAPKLNVVSVYQLLCPFDGV